ncbi:MAG: GNAT family N-acetyltransferase [Gemmiger sp.]
MMTQLRPMRPEEFGPVWKLMETSFPPDERRPRAAQQALTETDDRFTAYVLPGQTPAVQAVLTVWRLEDFAYLEHFAVDPSSRGHGLGAQLLAQLEALLPCPLCLEVEPPETDIARRRIRFYCRNGFALNAFAYTQPPYAPGQQAIPLQIMTTGGPVDAPRFERIRRALYTTVYGVPADAVFDR